LRKREVGIEDCLTAVGAGEFCLKHGECRGGEFGECAKDEGAVIFAGEGESGGDVVESSFLESIGSVEGDVCVVEWGLFALFVHRVGG
jgi:hypothetical protein